MHFQARLIYLLLSLLRITSTISKQPANSNGHIFEDLYVPLPPFGEGCPPNLTRVSAVPYVLGVLFHGRPVREVLMFSYPSSNPTDTPTPPGSSSTQLSLFTLSTTPIQKLSIHYNTLYPKPVSLLVSLFPSLVHFLVNAWDDKWIVRVPLRLSI